MPCFFRLFLYATTQVDNFNLLLLIYWLTIIRIFINRISLGHLRTISFTNTFILLPLQLIQFHVWFYWIILSRKLFAVFFNLFLFGLTIILFTRWFRSRFCFLRVYRRSEVVMHSNQAIKHSKFFLTESRRIDDIYRLLLLPLLSMTSLSRACTGSSCLLLLLLVTLRLLLIRKGSIGWWMVRVNAWTASIWHLWKYTILCS